MNRASNSRPEAPPAAKEADAKGQQTTPNATPREDMQGQDAGTAGSGTGARGTAAESVMKQEHKTAHESDSRR